MPEGTISIRDPAAADESAWRSLWSGYNAFYQTTVPEAVTARTWQRILDPASPIFGRLAVANDLVAGFSICVLHEGTWVIAPVCYLEDLFVAPKFRGTGLGRMLIADVVDRAKANDCSRLYWHTRENNPARRLYDEFAKADDFVRYRLVLPDKTRR
jgi:GNAT superfamily N-acetyltransferase